MIWITNINIIGDHIKTLSCTFTSNKYVDLLFKLPQCGEKGGNLNKE